MPHLRLRVKLNKGRHGIPLDKLEKVVAETRRFLMQAAEDLEVDDPSVWRGVDFENSSLAFTTESVAAVPDVKVMLFNESITSLGRSEYPKTLQESTAQQFFKIASVLDKSETADFAVFGEDGTLTWIEVSHRTALLAHQLDVLPFRVAQGSVQGTFHSIHPAAEKPYFTLRELSSRELIKCFYSKGDYDAIWVAAKVMDTVLHVRGAVVTDTRKRSIDHVTVTNIVVADPYSFADVEKFLGNSWRQ